MFCYATNKSFNVFRLHADAAAPVPDHVQHDHPETGAHLHVPVLRGHLLRHRLLAGHQRAHGGHRQAGIGRARGHEDENLDNVKLVAGFLLSPTFKSTMHQTIQLEKLVSPSFCDKYHLLHFCT